CNFTEKISLLIDGELAPAEAREVERHLLNCSECEQLRADFLNLRSTIASFETSLQPAVQNRALKKILSRDRERRVPASQWAFSTQAVAFAALLIVGAIIGLILYQSKRAPESHTAVVQTPSPLPSVSTEQNKQAPEASPEPAKEMDQPNKKETQSPRRPAPVKRPVSRDPKPGEQFAAVPERLRPADAETMTAMHFEKSETLLRSFRNVRMNEPGAAAEVSYERKRAQQLVYQNMMLRREADAAGDVQIASLLESLEPILIDIANLPDKPDADAVRIIRERVERKNIVGLLQINSTALARALD
ncbi:MAG TPA: zf-HC2 domain-containing protein, partial [Pyrinomonadaceae bacterium]|nr:zf-HC2 domain-containing protein [Pyrinomonadaceae bacterium]